MKEQIKQFTAIGIAKKASDIQDAATLLPQAGQLMPTNIHATKGRFQRQAGTIKLSWRRPG